MNRNILLIRSNIRKAKGQIAAIVVLVLLSSSLMNLWLMLSMDYQKNFERSHERLNDGHVTVAAYTREEAFREALSELLWNSDEVTEFTMTDAFCMPGSFLYGGGEIMSSFVVLNKEEAVLRSVGKFEITQEGAFDSGIYLPLIYGTGGNYSVGDTIELTLGTETFTYTVCGFFNSAMAGTHNCVMVSFLLTEDCFLELSEKSTAAKSTYISIRMKEKTGNEELKASLIDELSERFPNVLTIRNGYDEVKTARYISQMICAGGYERHGIFCAADRCGCHFFQRN